MHVPPPLPLSRRDFLARAGLDGSSRELLAAEFIRQMDLVFRNARDFDLIHCHVDYLAFPFTRLVHVWSAPIWYLGRRGYQVVRSSGRPHAPRPAPRVVQPAE